METTTLLANLSLTSSFLSNSSQAFHSFPRLAAELRSQIWLQIDSDQPYIVRVVVANKMRIQTPLPLILQINQESRDHALKIYKRYFISSQEKEEGRPIYMDPKRHTLLFELPRSIGHEDLKIWMMRRIFKLPPKFTDQSTQRGVSSLWAPGELTFVFLWGAGSRRWLGNCYYFAIKDNQCEDLTNEDLTELGYTTVWGPFAGNYSLELMWREIFKTRPASGPWLSFV